MLSIYTPQVGFYESTKHRKDLDEMVPRISIREKLIGVDLNGHVGTTRSVFIIT